MRVQFQDLQESSNPLNGVRIERAHELLAVLDELRLRVPFGLELSSENGCTLTILLAQDSGAVEYRSTNGDPPYFEAVSPGSSTAKPNEDSAYAAAVRADLEKGIKAPTFLVGGTPTPVPTRYVLPYDLVKEVALYFLKTGQRKPDLGWDEI